MRARKMDLLRRRIVGVDFRPFEDGRGGKTTDPLLLLDDGSALHFVVEETEDLVYGVAICITKKEDR